MKTELLCGARALSFALIAAGLLSISSSGCTPLKLEEKTPEFFGVYALTHSGKLIELKSEPPFSFRLSRPPQDNWDDFAQLLESREREPEYYYAENPANQLRLSDVEGIYIFGDYGPMGGEIMKTVQLRVFKPFSMPSDRIIVEGSDSGPGITGPETYIDTKKGYTIESQMLRYVSKKTNLYWIVPQEGIDLDRETTKEGGSFLVVSLEGPDGSDFYPLGSTASLDNVRQSVVQTGAPPKAINNVSPASPSEAQNEPSRFSANHQEGIAPNRRVRSGLWFWSGPGGGYVVRRGGFGVNRGAGESSGRVLRACMAPWPWFREWSRRSSGVVVWLGSRRWLWQSGLQGECVGVTTREFEADLSGVAHDEGGNAKYAEQQCLEAQGFVVLGQRQGLEGDEQVVGQGDDTQVRSIDEEIAGRQCAQFKIPFEFFDLVLALAALTIPRDLFLEWQGHVGDEGMVDVRAVEQVVLHAFFAYHDETVGAFRLIERVNGLAGPFAHAGLGVGGVAA